MERKALFIILITIFISQLANACMCDIMDTKSSKYLAADFVATVKILKNYKNQPDTSEYYKADVELINLYKGKKIKHLLILGTNGGTRYNSCGTFIAEGETRLIFGKFYGESNISTYLCNSYINPLSTNFKLSKLDEKLRLLNRYAKNITVETLWGRTVYIPSQLYQTSTTDTTYLFSIVKIVITEDGMVKKIQHLTKDNKAFIAKLDVALTTKMDWLSRIKPYKTKSDLTFLLELDPYERIKPMKLL